MKVKKSSWHYKFLKWMDMEPYPFRLTKRYYQGTFVVCVFYFLVGGWIVEGIRHLVNRLKSEPVEYIDDENDNKENIE